MSTGIPRPRTASFSLHISTSASHVTTNSSSSSSSTSSPSNLGRVPLDARVVLSKRRAGYVRYIGKLATEAGEWYGVALDEAKGEHDGRWHGVAYFACAAHHGVFVRRKEIFYVKEQPTYIKNPPSPVMHDTSDEDDAPTATGSSDSDASNDSTDAALSSPMSASTTSASALQRTFKSFHRVLQSPAKLGQSLLGGATSTTASPVMTPSRRTPTRTSMIPPPSIATTPKHTASRHQSIVFHQPIDLLTTAATTPSVVSSPPAFVGSPERSRTSSMFDDADEFAAMTNALAGHNNAIPSPPSPPSPTSSLPLPPQIHGDTSREISPLSSPQRRPSTERRHSTFAFGTPSTTVSSLSSSAIAAANSVRVVELEKEIVTMRTNHENVVAVLRATNKQHAANVLELRVQVSALADGNNYLQRQLSLKSTQLHELKQTHRTMESDRSEQQTNLHQRDAAIQQLEQEMAALKKQMHTAVGEKESVLLHMQREFQAKQLRDREHIKKLRDDVVSLVNSRNALQADLDNSKEMSWFL